MSTSIPLQRARRAKSAVPRRYGPKWSHFGPRITPGAPFCTRVGPFGLPTMEVAQPNPADVPAAPPEETGTGRSSRSLSLAQAAGLNLRSERYRQTCLDGAAAVEPGRGARRAPGRAVEDPYARRRRSAAYRAELATDVGPRAQHSWRRVGSREILPRMGRRPALEVLRRARLAPSRGR